MVRLFSNSTIYTLLPLLFKGNINYNRTILMPLTGSVLGILDLLTRNKRIQGYQVLERNDSTNLISIGFCYADNQPRLSSFRFISKPGRRTYVSAWYLRKKIMRLPNSMFVLSTTHGLLSGQEAVLLNTGGELICVIG